MLVLKDILAQVWKSRKTEMTAYEMEESSSAPSAERRPLKRPAHPNAFKRQKRAFCIQIRGCRRRRTAVWIRRAACAAPILDRRTPPFERLLIPKGRRRSVQLFNRRISLRLSFSLTAAKPVCDCLSGISNQVFAVAGCKAALHDVESAFCIASSARYRGDRFDARPPCIFACA